MPMSILLMMPAWELLSVDAPTVSPRALYLNDKEYNLAINNGPNHLHGGPTGFAQRVWTGKVTDDKVTFTRISPDGEEGYPGILTVSVTYGWSEDNELSIVYEASCDQDTVFSVTSHGYFNLNGEGNGTVLDQELRIDADAITELDDTQCPTGAFLSVEGSPFDFREMKKSVTAFTVTMPS